MGQNVSLLLVDKSPIPILSGHSKKSPLDWKPKWAIQAKDRTIIKKMHVSEVINFVPLLNSLKIKQSWFKMIYDHVSISKTNFVNPLYPLWAKKKIFLSNTPNEDDQQSEV